ncbi:DMP19 family protein [Endozoicomonadaceae bacterium StTr2]
MPCKNGYRENIEASKEYYKKERELDKTCPFRALWRELHHKVFKTNEGFDGLTEAEKTYFAVNILVGEVYNGGFDQYFNNSSGSQYRFAEYGLVQLGATHSLKLLRKAKQSLFENHPVPADQAQRQILIEKICPDADLDDLDTEFYKDHDDLDTRIEAFAVKTGMVKIEDQINSNG